MEADDSNLNFFINRYSFSTDTPTDTLQPIQFLHLFSDADPKPKKWARHEDPMPKKVGDRSFIRKKPPTGPKRRLEPAMTAAATATTDTPATDTSATDTATTSGFNTKPIAPRAPPATGAPEIALDEHDMTGTV